MNVHAYESHSLFQGLPQTNTPNATARSDFVWRTKDHIRCLRRSFLCAVMCAIGALLKAGARTDIRSEFNETSIQKAQKLVIQPIAIRASGFGVEVLVEEIKRRKDELNMAWLDAITHAAISRLRPVTMAAITTVLGMLPLLGDVFFKPMAVTIMFGLGFATLLTLIVVPVLFALLYRVRFSVVHA